MVHQAAGVLGLLCVFASLLGYAMGGAIGATVGAIFPFLALIIYGGIKSSDTRAQNG